MSSADGNRVGVSQPGGPGTPAVVGVLDSRHIFWPELEVSFASDGFIETLELDDTKPQDWSYAIAVGADEERQARAKILASRGGGMSARRTPPPPPRLDGIHDGALDAFQEAFNHLANLHVRVRHDAYDDGREHRMLFSLPGAVRSAIIAWEEAEDDEGVQRGGVRD